MCISTAATLPPSRAYFAFFTTHHSIDYLHSKAVVVACNCITVQCAEPYDVLDADCEAIS
jgi:hypothetical protein